MNRNACLPLLPAAILTAGVAWFLATQARIGGGAGFPLDDSWIHLALARNLVTGGGFAITPGDWVGASTAPLWTLLLAPVVALGGASPQAIAALAFGLTIIGLELVRRLYLAYRPDRLGEAATAAALTAALPSTVWGVLSGLEVPLAILITAAVLLAHVRLRDCDGWRALVPSLLIGLATLARPEAMLLLPLALLDDGSWRQPRRLALRLAAFAVPVTPLLVFHLAAHGLPLPTTFYAKIHHSRHPDGGQGLLWALTRGGAGPTVELLYHWSFTHLGLFLRTLLTTSPLLVLLVPIGAGLAASPTANGRSRPLLPLLALVLVPWLIGVLTPRPDFGQGDRYISFLNPIVGIFAAAGLIAAARRLPRAAVAVAVVFLVVSVGAAMDRGARRFAWSVRNTNEMQVALAHWVREHVPAGSLVAAHDIGALAFHAPVRILDLEGIASPEMLDAKRSNATRFAALYQRRPAYLIVAPAWYPDLLRHDDVLEAVHVQRIPAEQNHVLADAAMVVLRATWPGAN